MSNGYRLIVGEYNICVILYNPNNLTMDDPNNLTMDDRELLNQRSRNHNRILYFKFTFLSAMQANHCMTQTNHNLTGK